jgi:UrcA family protein
MTAPRYILPTALMFTACAAAVIVLVGFSRVSSPGVPAPAAISVSSSDLDFNRPEDAQTLFERIKEASVQACGGAPESSDLHRISAFEQCRTAAIKRAVAQVGQPMLTAVADTQTIGMRIAAQ